MSPVHYSGTYVFADRATLEASIAYARNQINEDDDLAALGGGWLRCFVMSGTQLTVNLEVPALPEHRFAAAAVFDLIARAALVGSVTARIDQRAVDEFIAGDDELDG